MGAHLILVLCVLCADVRIAGANVLLVPCRVRSSQLSPRTFQADLFHNMNYLRHHACSTHFYEITLVHYCNTGFLADPHHPRSALNSIPREVLRRAKGECEGDGGESQRTKLSQIYVQV